MISADLGRGLCMLGLLFTGSEGTLWIAYPLVFLATVFSSLLQAGDELGLARHRGGRGESARANSIWSQMDAVSFVLGPALGGVLALLGAPRARVRYQRRDLPRLRRDAPLRPHPAPQAPAETEGDEEEGWLSETLAGFRFLFRENEGVLAALTISFVGLTFDGGGIWTLILVLSERAFEPRDGGERVPELRLRGGWGLWAVSRRVTWPPRSGSGRRSSGA